MVTSYVQKLADKKCQQSKAAITCDGNVSDCPTCHGTGALVPKLRQRCEALAVWTPINFMGEARPEDTNPRSSNNLDFCHRNNCRGGCQGCGWTLLEPEKQMGVLTREAKRLCIWPTDTGWSANVNYGEGQGGADTPEEAAGQAILQTLEVKLDGQK